MKLLLRCHEPSTQESEFERVAITKSKALVSSTTHNSYLLLVNNDDKAFVISKNESPDDWASSNLSTLQLEKFDGTSLITETRGGQELFKEASKRFRAPASESASSFGFIEGWNGRNSLASIPSSSTFLRKRSASLLS